MRPFEYLEPSTLDEAVALLERGNGSACVLAGGTDLLVQMREHVRRPEQVINIKKIPGIDDFSVSASDGLRIGALTTTRCVETSPLVRRHYAGLCQAVTHFASIQVRNRATIVGNVCRASPSADTLPPLIADAAQLTLRGPSGMRAVAVEDFCSGPGKTVLAPGEMVTHVIVPPPSPRTGKAYLKHGRRIEMELATVGAAVTLTLDEGGVCSEIRIALAAVAPTPIRARRAEALLRRQSPSAELIAAAAQAASEESLPIGDVRGSAAYRRHMVGVLTRRALEQALKEAQR
ncbi:MAG: xanthine dehydrogenase family protein subunit M [Ideonella sp.]|nr:xanthine dehydrogenase family protein subunit M [Ideonella sp.]